MNQGAKFTSRHWLSAANIGGSREAVSVRTESFYKLAGGYVASGSGIKCKDANTVVLQGEDLNKIMENGRQTAARRITRGNTKRLQSRLRPLNFTYFPCRSSQKRCIFGEM